MEGITQMTMKQTTRNTLCGTAALILAVLTSPAMAQHTVTTAFVGAPPAGAGQPFQIELLCSGPSANISAFVYRLYYDSSRMDLVGTSGIDNTGQPGAGFALDIGPQIADASVPGFNAFRMISGSTLDPAGLVNPTHLGMINAMTGAGSENLHVQLVGSPDDADGATFLDESFAALPEPLTVDTLPVSVSNYSLE